MFGDFGWSVLHAIIRAAMAETGCWLLCTDSGRRCDLEDHTTTGILPSCDLLRELPRMMKYPFLLCREGICKMDRNVLDSRDGWQYWHYSGVGQCTVKGLEEVIKEAFLNCRSSKSHC